MENLTADSSKYAFDKDTFNQIIDETEDEQQIIRKKMEERRTLSEKLEQDPRFREGYLEHVKQGKGKEDKKITDFDFSISEDAQRKITAQIIGQEKEVLKKVGANGLTTEEALDEVERILNGNPKGETDIVDPVYEKKTENTRYDENARKIYNFYNCTINFSS